MRFLASPIFLAIVLAPCCMATDTPEMRVLAGQVADTEGKPVAGATVEWGHFSAAFGEREAVTTDADGCYRLETRNYQVDYRLGVWKTGFGPTWMECVVPDPPKRLQPHDFVLRPPIQVKGWLRDRDTDTPIAGAAVVVETQANRKFGYRQRKRIPFPGPLREAQTDSDGMFVIGGLPDEKSDPFFVQRLTQKKPPGNPARTHLEYKFQVWYQTGRKKPQQGGDLSPNQPGLVGPRRLLGGGTRSRLRIGAIKGRVFDKHTREPITRFFVSKTNHQVDEFQEAEGRFTFGGLVAGSWPVVRIDADGYETLRFRRKVDVLPESLVDCELSRATELRGQLINDANEPIGHAEIISGIVAPRANFRHLSWDRIHTSDKSERWTTINRRTTGTGGNFTFQDDHLLAITAKGFARRFISDMDSLTADDDGVIRIRLRSECRLKGTVTAFENTDSKSRLWISRDDNSEIAPGKFYTDENGRFDIPNLNPGGYIVWATLPSGTVRFTHRIMLQPGQTLERRLNDSGGPFTISGNAVPFSEITIKEENAQFLTAGTLADADGSYRIAGLRRGEYVLTMRDTSWWGSSVNAAGARVSLHGDRSHDFRKVFSPNY